MACGAAHEVALVVPLGHVKRVVRDDDLGHVVGEGAEAFADLRDLTEAA
jgi:hypothetical protein